MVTSQRYTFAPVFDFFKHGANVGTYCPVADQPCAVEMDGHCPLGDPEMCSDENDHVITAFGFVVPDPLDAMGARL